MKVNSLGDEMAVVLTLSLVDRGFNTQLCQSKDHFSAEYAAVRVKANTLCHGIL